MKKWRCIIVDDDEIDRLMVVSFAKRFENLDILGIFNSANDALTALENLHVDIMFVDIDMPKLNGIEFRRKTKTIPVCIFITAHPEFAVESFELDTLDFIVKPIKFDRFQQTMQRIEAFMEIKQKALLFESTLGADTIYIKEGHEQTKIKLHDIFYMEALKDYTLIFTEKKRHCVLSTIGNLLKESHFQSFIRIHRSFAIQKQYIKKINVTDLELHNNMTIPIGRFYKDNLNFVI